MPSPKSLPKWLHLAVTSGETSTAHALWRAVAEALTRYGVDSTPWMLLRAADLVMSHIDVRRLEIQLAESVESGTAPSPTAYDAAGKARERLRKAIKDFEDACARAGTPVDTGLADRVRPVLDRAAGVLDEALAHPSDDDAHAWPNANDRIDPRGPGKP